MLVKCSECRFPLKAVEFGTKKRSCLLLKTKNTDLLWDRCPKIYLGFKAIIKNKKKKAKDAAVLKMLHTKKTCLIILFYVSNVKQKIH